MAAPLFISSPFRSKLEMTRNRMTNAAQLRDKSFRGDPRGFSRATNFHDTFYTGESPLSVHHARCVRDSLEMLCSKD